MAPRVTRVEVIDDEELIWVDGDLAVPIDQAVEGIARGLLRDGFDRDRVLLTIARDRFSRWSDEDLVREYLWLLFEPDAVNIHALPPFPPRRPAPSVGNPTLAQWREENSHLLQDPCSYCGGPATTLDHIDPRWVGGLNVWENATAACQSCNSSKGRWPLLVWLARHPVGAMS